jgi:hypothetical protein
MKLTILSAAVVLSSLLAAPAMGRHVVTTPGRYAQSYYCTTRDPGNPYSAKDDYMTWSAWRRLGAWDSRGDDACLRNPWYSPPGSGLLDPSKNARN